MVRPGDTVGDRYQVIEQLASGGMSTVWRARHVELEADVAVKVIATEHRDAPSLERFKREAKAAARLKSPHIVQVLDYGAFEGDPFIVMELLAGESLASRIARDGKMGLAESLHIVRGMARGVQVAHGQGIIHRDLKPANIFLERVGTEAFVKILDFGVAKDLFSNLTSGGTAAGELVGSPAYMSPEQVWGEKIEFRSDVWAMGVVAFEMLTGKNPFRDETLAKIFERIVRDPLPSACDLNPSLPSSIDSFFRKALARSASERIPSPEEFAKQFEAAVDEHPLSSPPPAKELFERAPEHSPLPHAGAASFATEQRPRRARIALVLGVLALLATGAAVLFVRGTSERPQSKTPEVPLEPPPSADHSAAPPVSIPVAAPSAAAVTPPPAPASSASTVTRAKRPRSSASKELDPLFGVPVRR